MLRTRSDSATSSGVLPSVSNMVGSGTKPSLRLWWERNCKDVQLPFPFWISFVDVDVKSVDPSDRCFGLTNIKSGIWHYSCGRIVMIARPDA
jgi:hypothetical protein